MAMDEIWRLAKAVVVDAAMCRPERYEELVPVGNWTTARVLDVALSVDHKRGWYFGAVRYVVEGSEHAEQKTFNTLWMEGWTSMEFRDRVLEEQKKRGPKLRPYQEEVIKQLRGKGKLVATGAKRR